MSLVDGYAGVIILVVLDGNFVVTRCLRFFDILSQVLDLSDRLKHFTLHLAELLSQGLIAEIYCLVRIVGSTLLHHLSSSLPMTLMNPLLFLSKATTTLVNQR